MIAGSAASTGPHPNVSWNCNEGSNRPGPYGSAVEAACHTARDASSTSSNPTYNKVRLGVHIDFPTCLNDAEQLNPKTGPGNTADFSGNPNHNITQRVAYATGPTSNRTCPAGFQGRKMPFLRMAIQFLDKNGNGYRGNGTDIALTSGPRDSAGDLIPGEASQYTMHGDFWNTWVRDEPNTESDLVGMINRCINTTSGHPHGSSIVCGTT